MTNAPKQATWWVAVILGGLGVLASFVAIPTLSAYSSWLVILGFAILAIATVVKGL